MTSISRISIFLLVLSTVGPAWAQPRKPPPLVPPTVSFHKGAARAIADDLITDTQRTALRIFHGQWTELNAEAKNSAAYALAQWDLKHPSLTDAKTAPMHRALAAFRSGHLAATVDAIKGLKTPEAIALRGEALMDMGQFGPAIDTLTPLRTQLRAGKFTTVSSLRAAAEAMIHLAELEGLPADDYKFALSILTRVHQRLDSLNWPALVAEGQLLMQKGRPAEAVKSLHRALQLNPSCSQAYYELGKLGVSFYNFVQAEAAIKKLREINKAHILADLLEIELYLTQKDTPKADALLAKTIKQWPNHQVLLALSAAVAAQRHDDDRLAQSLDRFEKTVGRYPLARFLAGIYMSKGRQYAKSEKLLRAAIARHPNWSAPRVELGWVLHQAAKETESLKVLKEATRLDPFHVRALNSYAMLKALSKYKRIETKHFIIKYSHEVKDEVDRVLAADMADQLDKMFEQVTSAFDYRPRGKTLLEIMPNKEWFAVRITGMPDIWTIGACTGPVIAITPPRIGKRQAGAYDWYRVIRHEFTHTVTLEMTGNRIPHWFTEACAVSQEPGPRDYSTSQLLAKSLANDELFTLETLNWGFVRPKKPTDRPLAYAQSHWIFEYITEKYGREAILKMLKLAQQAVPESQIIAQATGTPNDKFYEQFLAWARTQVASWGMSPTPSTKQILDEIKAAGANREQKIQQLIIEHPDHPDLLQAAAALNIRAGEDQATLDALNRYAKSRPVDPWADLHIAAVATRLGKTDLAIKHLERLDKLDQYTGRHAIALADLYSLKKQWAQALDATVRAVIRQPYNASLREQAATLGLRAGKMDQALRHLLAVAGLEPDREIHHLRLAAIYHKLKRVDDADASARQAIKLNPKSAAKRFLKPN